MRGGYFVILVLLVIGVILISSGLRGRSEELIKAFRS